MFWSRSRSKPSFYRWSRSRKKISGAGAKEKWFGVGAFSLICLDIVNCAYHFSSSGSVSRRILKFNFDTFQVKIFLLLSVCLNLGGIRMEGRKCTGLRLPVVSNLKYRYRYCKGISSAIALILLLPFFAKTTKEAGFSTKRFKFSYFKKIYF